MIKKLTKSESIILLSCAAAIIIVAGVNGDLGDFFQRILLHV